MPKVDREVMMSPAKFIGSLALCVVVIVVLGACTMPWARPDDEPLDFSGTTTLPLDQLVQKQFAASYGEEKGACLYAVYSTELTLEEIDKLDLSTYPLPASAVGDKATLIARTALDCLTVADIIVRVLPDASTEQLLCLNWEIAEANDPVLLETAVIQAMSYSEIGIPPPALNVQMERCWVTFESESAPPIPGSK